MAHPYHSIRLLAATGGGMPEVTVVVPAYNAALTLARTLDSVHNQTFTDIEIFVVDDGSTDETPMIAAAFATKDPRIKVIRQENAGVAAARNRGLFAASGQFVSWIDSDDIWHPMKIEKQLAIFNKSAIPLSFVYTGYRLIDKNDNVIPNFRTLADVSGHTLCRQIATNFFSNVSSIMVPTHLAQRFGGHDPRLRSWGIEGSEDLLLQLQLSTLGAAGCCQEALVGYRRHHCNMSLDYSRSAKSNQTAIELIQQMHPNVPDWVFRLGRARTVGYCLHLLKSKRPLAALKLFLSLMGGQPLYTLLVLGLIVEWEMRKALLPDGNTDPELARHFLEADPATVPWLGHMLLTSWHRARLDQADAERMQPRRAPTLRPRLEGVKDKHTIAR